jgi:hypothetical protein
MVKLVDALFLGAVLKHRSWFRVVTFSKTIRRTDVVGFYIFAVGTIVIFSLQKTFMFAFIWSNTCFWKWTKHTYNMRITGAGIPELGVYTPFDSWQLQPDPLRLIRWETPDK